MTMPITETRAALAEAIDDVRTQREPLYPTRRHKPVAVLVDIASYTALTKAQATPHDPQSEPMPANDIHAHPARAADLRTAGTIVGSLPPTPQPAGLPITRPATRHGFSEFPLHPAEGRPLSEILGELREDRV